MWMYFDLGKPADWENRWRFILMLQPSGSLGGGREKGRQKSLVSEGVEFGFIGHAHDQNERQREGKDTCQEE